MWIEEIAVAGAHMTARCRATSALQDKLPRHELSIVFADGSLGRVKARMSKVSRSGPFPKVTEQLSETCAQSGRARGCCSWFVEKHTGRWMETRCGAFPFGLAWQPRA